MQYLTNGTALYELVSERSVKNHGLGRGTIRYLIVMDCLTLELMTLNERDMVDLRPVVPAAPVEIGA